MREWFLPSAGLALCAATPRAASAVPRTPLAGNDAGARRAPARIVGDSLPEARAAIGRAHLDASSGGEPDAGLGADACAPVLRGAGTRRAPIVARVSRTRRCVQRKVRAIRG